MNPPVVASEQFVDCLRAILPPARVLHVGAGTGAGTMHAWRAWPLESAWLIDAEPACMEWLEPLVAAHPGWHARTATLTAHAGTADFHHASNPAESGLADPAALRALWPNLQHVRSEPRATVTLDSLVDAAPAGRHGDWLLVDCLAAPAILRGAARTLERCSVVWARTLLDPLADGPDDGLAGSLAQLRDVLEPLGFHHAHLGECNHPAVAEAVFVRAAHADGQADSRAGREAAEANAAEAAALRQELLQLQRQHQEQAALLNERKERLQHMQAALAEQQAGMDERARQHQLETAALHDRLAALEEEHAAQAGALARAAEARDEENLQRQMQETARQADLLLRSEEELAQVRQALDAAQTALGTLADEAERLRDRLAEAEQDRQRTADELAQVRQTLDAAQAAHDALADEARGLREQLDAAEQAGQQHVRTEQELTQVRKALDTVQAARDALAGEAQRLRDDLHAAEQGREQHARTGQELVQARAALDAAQGAHATLVDEAQGLRDRLHAAEQAGQRAGDELVQVRQALDAAQADRAALADEAQALRDQLHAAEQAGQCSADELVQVRQALDAARAAHGAAADEAQRLRADAQAAQRQQHAQQAQELKNHQAALAEKDIRIQQREAEITLLTARQQQLDEELVRAEAQIDLIKDVLLREQGL